MSEQASACFDNISLLDFEEVDTQTKNVQELTPYQQYRSMRVSFRHS
jgi:hypothetical protein